MSLLFKRQNSGSDEANQRQYEQLAEEIRAIYGRVEQPTRKQNPELILTELKALVKKVKAAKSFDKHQRETLEAFIHDTAGLINFEAEQWPEALLAFERARPIYEKLPDKAPLVNNLANSGRSWFKQGDFVKSRALFEKALATAKVEGLAQSQSDILYQLGLLYQLDGQLQQALEQFQQGLLLAGRLNDPVKTATFLTQVGQLYSEEGDWEKSQDYYERSLTILEQAHDSSNLLVTLGQYDQLCRKRADYDRAITFAQRGLDLALQTKRSSETAIFLHDLGMIYLDKQDWEQAQVYGQQELDLACQMVNITNQLRALNVLAQSRLGLKDLKAARQLATQGLQLAESSSSKREQVIFYSVISDIELAEKRPKEALQILEKMTYLLIELADLATLSALYIRMGELSLTELRDTTWPEKLTLRAYALSANSNNEIAMYGFISVTRLIQIMVEKFYYADALKLVALCLSHAQRDLRTVVKNKKAAAPQKGFRLVFVQALTILMATTQDLVNGKRDYQSKAQELVQVLSSRFGENFMMDEWTRTMYERINS